MVEKVFDIIKGNLKNPRFYVVTLAVVIIILVLFPYIDANYFYYNRVEKRINILKDVLEIEKDLVEDNPILSAEYESILTEISKQKDGSLGSVFITNNSRKVNTVKFITGGSLMWLLGILCLFIKMDKKGSRLLGIIIFGLLGIVAGYISVIIPTIIKPAINYVLMPILQIVLVGILATSGKK